MSGLTGNMLAKKQRLAPVQVFLRIRPKHNDDGAPAIMYCTPKEIHMKGHLKGYSYDQIFDENTSQMKVYKTVAGKTISDVCKGYNCTIFAYGQTGTGKTYTVIGDDFGRAVDQSFSWQEESTAGIIPRAAMHLYDELDKMDPSLQRTVTVSFMEIYNEEIRDLLCDKELSPLRIYEDKMKSVHVKNLQDVTVLNPLDIINLLKKGCEKRQVAATLMNSNSSRSHTVFTISVSTMQTISMVENISNITCGKLNLIDLAGSENIAKSGSREQRAREATNINQSLLTLGRVIKALVENSSHVPYRESKLTRILQDSLGGKSKTSIIATISPGMASLDETMNTLDYAHNARSITNCPTINLRTSATAAAVQEELQRLKRDLFATANEQGIYMDKENYDEMTQSLTQFKKEIAHKHDTIRALTEQVEDLEAQKHEWENLKESFNKTNQAYQVMKTEIQRREEEMLRDNELLEYYKTQSSKLEEFANQMLTRENHLHKKLANVSASTSKNQRVIQDIIEIVKKTLDGLLQPADSRNAPKMEFSKLIHFNQKISNMINNVSTRLKEGSRNIEDVGENFNRSVVGEVSDSIGYLNEKLVTFTETCNDKIYTLSNAIRTISSYLDDLKELHQKEKEKKLQLSTLLNNDCRNYEMLEENLNKIKSQQSSSMLDYLEERQEMIDREQRRIHELKNILLNSEYRIKLAEYTESRKRIFERMANLDNLHKEAFVKLESITDKALQAVGRCEVEDIKNSILFMRNEASKVLEHIIINSERQNSEMATVLDQITKILNIEGNTQVQMLHESLNKTRKELIEEVEQRAEMSIPLTSTGDTPKPLEGPQCIPRNRLSLVKTLFKQDKSGMQ